MKRRNRKIILCGAGVVVTYFALIALWPYVGVAYTRVSAVVLDVFMGDLGWGARARFSAGSGDEGPRILGKLSHPRWSMPVPLKLKLSDQLYMQTILFAALVLWSPVSIRRRIWAFVIGGSMLHLILYVTVWVTVIRAMMSSSVKPFELSPLSEGILNRAFNHLTIFPVFWLSIPIIIWALVTFRRGDLKALINGSADQQTTRRMAGKKEELSTKSQP